jgi:hypothetical protein
MSTYPENPSDSLTYAELGNQQKLRLAFPHAQAAEQTVTTAHDLSAKFSQGLTAYKKIIETIEAEPLLAASEKDFLIRFASIPESFGLNPAKQIQAELKSPQAIRLGVELIDIILGQARTGRDMSLLIHGAKFDSGLLQAKSTHNENVVRSVTRQLLAKNKSFLKDFNGEILDFIHGLKEAKERLVTPEKFIAIDAEKPPKDLSYKMETYVEKEAKNLADLNIAHAKVIAAMKANDQVFRKLGAAEADISATEMASLKRLGGFTNQFSSDLIDNLKSPKAVELGLEFISANITGANAVREKSLVQRDTDYDRALYVAKIKDIQYEQELIVSITEKTPKLPVAVIREMAKLKPEETTVQAYRESFNAYNKGFLEYFNGASLDYIRALKQAQVQLSSSELTNAQVSTAATAAVQTQKIYYAVEGAKPSYAQSLPEKTPPRIY